MNDIASALEKLNISDEQITTIKSNLTDVTGYDNIQQALGQLISVLATARSQDVEYVEELNSSTISLISSKPSLGSTSYVGNGQKEFSITMDSSTDLFFIFSNSYVGLCDRHHGIVLNGRYASYLLVENISGNRFTISNDMYANEHNTTYNVYYFY